MRQSGPRAVLCWIARAAMLINALLARVRLRRAVQCEPRASRLANNGGARRSGHYWSSSQNLVAFSTM